MSDTRKREIKLKKCVAKVSADEKCGRKMTENFLVVEGNTEDKEENIWK